MNEGKSVVSGDLYPTCSIIIPIVHCMENKITSTLPQPEIGEQFKTHLKTAVQTSFQKMEFSSLFATATLLDPRLKKINFKSQLAVSSALNRIDNDLKIFVQLDAQNVRHAQEPPAKKSKSIWDYYDLLNENADPDSLLNPIRFNGELEQYMQLKRVSRKENIFSYWQTVRKTFPNLSKIALRQLSVVGTSVPSERLFSKAKLIKRDNRNRLTGNHLNMLVFLNSLNSKDWDLE